MKILVPGAHIDTKAVRKLSKHRCGPLLAARSELFEYQPTIFHVKVMIVDKIMVSVGATNVDDRSFHLNDESNLNSYDPAFAREQIAIFEADRAKSRRVTLEAWKKRSLWEKFSERAVWLLHSQR